MRRTGQARVSAVVGSGRWGWIVPDRPWEIVRPLLPQARVRPQGGGGANIDDEADFAAVIYVLVSTYAWRALPPCFGASKSTVHRRSSFGREPGCGVDCIRECSSSWMSRT
ncbi:transposase [Streptomyces sp. IB2014 016-6]|nr:transposase [Streptomyces sp. IB2014 016-6]